MTLLCLVSRKATFGIIDPMVYSCEPNWINAINHEDVDLFVFYPGKPVLGLVVYLLEKPSIA